MGYWRAVFADGHQENRIKINPGNLQLSVLEVRSRSVFQVMTIGHHSRNTAECVVVWKLYRQEGPRQWVMESGDEHV